MSEDPLPDIGTIHERLAYARRRAGLTQKRLAERLDIGERTLQSYESGETKIPAELVPRIERVADLPPGWILYDGEGKDRENDKRRRPPPGSGLVGVILASFVIGFSPVAEGTAAVAPCHCAMTPGARQPRLKLARRSDSGRGRKGLRFRVVASSPRHSTEEVSR